MALSWHRSSRTAPTVPSDTLQQRIVLLLAGACIQVGRHLTLPAALQSSRHVRFELRQCRRVCRRHPHTSALSSTAFRRAVAPRSINVQCMQNARTPIGSLHIDVATTTDCDLRRFLHSLWRRSWTPDASTCRMQLSDDPGKKSTQHCSVSKCGSCCCSWRNAYWDSGSWLPIIEWLLRTEELTKFSISAFRTSARKPCLRHRRRRRSFNGTARTVVCCWLEKTTSTTWRDIRSITSSRRRAFVVLSCTMTAFPAAIRQIVGVVSAACGRLCAARCSFIFYISLRCSSAHSKKVGALICRSFALPVSPWHALLQRRVIQPCWLYKLNLILRRQIDYVALNRHALSLAALSSDFFQTLSDRRITLSLFQEVWYECFCGIFL